MKKFKVLAKLVLTIIVLFGLYIFVHSSPERVVREYLIGQGYFIKAFETEVYKSSVSPEYGQQYSCKNPGIGPDFFTFKRGFLNLYFTNHDGTGGG